MFAWAWVAKHWIAQHNVALGTDGHGTQSVFAVDISKCCVHVVFRHVIFTWMVPMGLLLLAWRSLWAPWLLLWFVVWASP